MTKFSIIIPAHDAEGTIERALLSAQAQTERDLEVIVVDDASHDHTPEIVTAMGVKDPRIQLIRSYVNGGPGTARNLALEHARGEWIALLDADDAFLPERLATLLAIAAERDVEMIADNMLLCPEDGTSAPVPMFSRERLSGEMLLSATEFVLGNVGNKRSDRVSFGFMQPIMRRDFLERNAVRYEPRNRFGEDFMLYVLCLVHGARWWYTPQPMYRYSVRAGSLTDKQSAADLFRIRELEARLLRENPMVAADPALAGALLRHQAKIDRDYHYRAFTDALKAREPGNAARLLFGSPGGFRHILQESLYQAPVIAQKALRGGYRTKGGASSNLAERS